MAASWLTVSVALLRVLWMSGVGASDANSAHASCGSDGKQACELDSQDANSLLQSRRLTPAPNISSASETAKCKRVTNRICAGIQSRCGPRHGAMSCVGSWCQCLEGFCANSHGDCVSPVKTVKADIIAGLPETTDKPKLGICLSGGGSRAMIWSMGVYRALSELGLLEKVDAVSAVSGGGWFSGQYNYAAGSDEELLGHKTRPEDLSLKVLGETPSKIGDTVVQATNSLIAQVLVSDVEWYQSYQVFIGEAFLQPHGLYDIGAYLAADEEHVKQIKTRNPGLEDAKFLIPRPDRPSTIVFLGTILAPLGYAPGANNVAGFQMSPGFVGIPNYPNGSTVDYQALPEELFTDPLHDVLIGGGLVESFAFTGSPPASSSDQEGGTSVEVGSAHVPFTLADILGITSQAQAAHLGNYLAGELTNPRAHYWPVTSPKLPANAKTNAMTHEIGDGGSIDNAGILPLLQRRVQRVLWVQACWEGIDLNYSWEAACKEGAEFDPVAAKLVDSFVDKFGYGPVVSDDSGGFYYEHNQVFNRSLLKTVGCEIWQHVANGTPAVVSFQSRVMNNTWWGIQGGFDVDVTVVYLDQSDDFVDALPNDTKAEYKKGSAGGLANYPFYATTMQNGIEFISYTATQVNLLAAQAEYSVVQHADAIKRLFEQ